MNILDIAIAKKLAGGGGGSGTDNYNDLSNLPKINDTTLSGNKSSSALGLQSEINSDSKLASDLVDDTNQDNKFVTSTEKNTWNGKQNAIDADHKINADYVDDSTSTNKFVTASDKETWNAKQNAIDNSHKLSSDLVDDTNHTNKFVTSTEKQTWNAKQNAIDADHKLTSSLVSFTTAEAAALASGIDSSKVGQISTNQTNILYALNTGVKNLIVCNEKKAVANGLTITRTQDGIQISGTATASFSLAITGNALAEETQDPYDYSVFSKLPSSVILTGAPDSVEQNRIIVALYNDQTWVYSFSSLYDMPQDLSNYNYNRWYAYIPIVQNKTYSGIWKPMLRDASISDDTFVPGALPNSDLTYLEAEDRAALAEEIDAGAKNMLQNTGTTTTISGVTFTVNSDGSVSTYGTSTADNITFEINPSFTFKSGTTYVLSGCPTGGSPNGYRLCTMGLTYMDDYGNGNGSVNVGDNSSRRVAIYIKTSGTNMGTSSSPKVFKPMLCTKAAFGVSKAFVPYRPNYDLVVSNLNDIPYKRLPINSSYNYRGIIIKAVRAVVQLAIISNSYIYGGVITLAYNSHNTMTANVSANFANMSQYVKFYKLSNEDVAIIAYTETKWDAISYIGGTVASTNIEIYQSNTAYPTGAVEFTPTAFPT